MIFIYKQIKADKHLPCGHIL